MGLPATKLIQPFTAKDYFTFAEQQEERYEYANGQFVAMGTTSGPHNEIVLNFATTLKAQTRKKGCKVYAESVALEVAQNGKYYLPDVMLTCDERDQEDRKLKRYPSVVIEVLSASSVKRDRGEKLQAYLKLASLQHYLLVSQDQIRVEIFSRGEAGIWQYQNLEGLEAVIHLTSPVLEISLAELYEEVALNSEEETSEEETSEDSEVEDSATP
ncbi:MAG: Uma2 family endonuclease [Bacteroidota bacterium]